MSKRVLLHVGTPKTGTSYLQDVLFRNRRTLAGAGIHYPADRFDAHFLAALDLMRLPWGGLEAEAVGAWDRLSEQVRNHGGTSIISHEILATASRSQAGRALTSLGHGDGTEVHLVLSVRDLVRQIPAEWQENVKHRSAITYGAFLDQIQDPRRESRIATWFWGVQELPDILNRWGHDLPPEHIHLVTVPPAGGAQQLLWKRFSIAFGLDGLDLDLEAERANPSLGAPETALVRRINRAANPELAPGDYRPLVRELLAHQTLSQRVRSPRLALPPDVHPWVGEVTALVDRRDRATRLRRRRRPRRPGRCTAGRRSTPTPTSPTSARSRRPRSTRSPRSCSRAPGCASPRSGCGASCTRPRWRSSGPTCARRTAGARRSCAGCSPASSAGVR